MLADPAERQLHCLRRLRAADGLRAEAVANAKSVRDTADADIERLRSLSDQEVELQRARVGRYWDEAIVAWPNGLPEEPDEQNVETGHSPHSLEDSIVAARGALDTLEVLVRELNLQSERTIFATSFQVGFLLAAAMAVAAWQLLISPVPWNLAIYVAPLGVLLLSIWVAVLLSDRAKRRDAERLCRLHRVAAAAADAASALATVREIYARAPSDAGIRPFERRCLDALVEEIRTKIDTPAEVLKLPAWGSLLEHESALAHDETQAGEAVDRVLALLTDQCTPTVVAEALYQRASSFHRREWFGRAHKNFVKADSIVPGYKDAVTRANQIAGKALAANVPGMAWEALEF